MKNYVAVVAILVIGCQLAGCNQNPVPRKSLKQVQLEEFISRCDKASPPYTPQQKIRLQPAVKKKRLQVTQAIQADAKMRGAHLKISTAPEAIDAGCSDATYVSVDGTVLTVQQKRVLQAICRRHSDRTVSVYGSSVGVKKST